MKNEIAFEDRKKAIKVLNLLVDSGYAVMITLEEDLTILNYEYAALFSGEANRNEVIFMRVDEFNEKSQEQ